MHIIIFKINDNDNNRYNDGSNGLHNNNNSNNNNIILRMAPESNSGLHCTSSSSTVDFATQLVLNI